MQNLVNENKHLRAQLMTVVTTSTTILTKLNATVVQLVGKLAQLQGRWLTWSISVFSYKVGGGSGR
jgi:hypothetical protein